MLKQKDVQASFHVLQNKIMMLISLSWLSFMHEFCLSYMNFALIYLDFIEGMVKLIWCDTININLILKKYTCY